MKIYVVSGFYMYDEGCFELDKIVPAVYITIEDANKEVKNLFEQYIRGYDWETINGEEIDDVENYQIKTNEGELLEFYALAADSGARVIISNSEFEI